MVGGVRTTTICIMDVPTYDAALCGWPRFIDGEMG